MLHAYGSPQLHINKSCLSAHFNPYWEPYQYSNKEVTMTKADLVECIQANIGISKQDSHDILETVFSIMKDTLESGENIKASGFGKFEVKQKKDRNGRNPHTGETMIITARRILTFKLSTVLKKAINKE
jgi:integration host factor subunit alpha